MNNEKTLIAVYYLLSVLGFILFLYFLMTDYSKLLFLHSNNIILKHSMSIILLYLSIFWLLLIFLIKKKYIAKDYFDTNSRERARHDVILLTLSSPVWLLTVIDLYVSNNTKMALISLSIIMIWLCYRLLFLSLLNKESNK